MYLSSSHVPLWPGKYSGNSWNDRLLSFQNWMFHNLKIFTDHIVICTYDIVMHDILWQHDKLKCSHDQIQSARCTPLQSQCSAAQSHIPGVAYLGVGPAHGRRAAAEGSSLQFTNSMKSVMKCEEGLEVFCMWSHDHLCHVSWLLNYCNLVHRLKVSWEKLDW